MRLALIAAIAFVSCNGSNEPKIASIKSEEQRKVDSLTEIINQKEEAERKAETLRRAKAKAREEVKERNSLIENVTYDQPRYDRLAFGGLENISFNFFNDSKHTLDQVILKVHYIRTNGSESRTETIVLTNVEPRSRKNLSAPDNPANGVEVQVSIESMFCKSLNFCMYYPNTDITLPDPFKCR
ncbi:MAG: hypothetical protein EOP48_14760 [Sphingobacteriales bacterium]|nr:MAG: hypothetical protein EOP48_14760 [Sphingobacteriales bacterium]